jgi:hypothetical protein
MLKSSSSLIEPKLGLTHEQVAKAYSLRDPQKNNNKPPLQKPKRPSSKQSNSKSRSLTPKIRRSAQPQIRVKKEPPLGEIHDEEKEQKQLQA